MFSPFFLEKTPHRLAGRVPPEAGCDAASGFSCRTGKMTCQSRANRYMIMIYADQMKG